MRRTIDALLRTVVAALLAASTLLTNPGAAGAATLSLTTTYPAIVVDAGGTARFPLSISASRATTVGLRVTSAPTGWKTTFRGGGSIISAVYVRGSTGPDVNLEVKVPADASPKRYDITVAIAEVPCCNEAGSVLNLGGAATLDLEVTVPESSGGGVTLSAQFPTLKGPSSATYRFDVTLQNDTSQQGEFTLQAAGPAGWTVDARPSSSTQAATAVVDAGQSTRIQVTATPPADAVADTYVITVQAAGGPAVAKVDLQVEITGTYAVQVTTPDGRLNAQVSAGGASPLTLEVRNTGSAPLAGLTLSATPPIGWEVTFDPPLIPAIAAEEMVTVTAHITPADDAIAGDYALTISARSDQASDSVEIRTAVQTSPLWGVVGLVAIGAVFVGLFLVFRRFGRR